MKTTLALSTLLATIVVGCGAAQNGATGASQVKENAPTTCSIQTYNGRYLTAVGGGGRTSDVIHSDATQVRAWEKFTLIDPGEGSPIPYGIKTSNGHFLSAVGG